MNNLFLRNSVNTIISTIAMKFKPTTDYKKYYNYNNRINKHNQKNHKHKKNEYITNPKKNNKLDNTTNLLKTSIKTSNKQTKLQTINKKRNEHKQIKKEIIPKRIRELVWTTHNTEVFSNKCYVSWCDNKINVFNFQVGHDIPESKGGTIDIDNLKPICGNCNLSMSNNYSIKEWSNLIINKNNKTIISPESVINKDTIITPETVITPDIKDYPETNETIQLQQKPSFINTIYNKLTPLPLQLPLQIPLLSMLLYPIKI